MTQIVRNDLWFYSTKLFKAVGSAAFRQHGADSHCKLGHGYGLDVKTTFRAGTLDKNNWVIDFGSLKPFKTWLEQTFDHKFLVAHDDPARESFRILHEGGLINMRIVESTGCESFALMGMNYLDTWLIEQKLAPRVQCYEVEVREHDANSAFVRKKD